MQLNQEIKTLQNKTEEYFKQHVNLVIERNRRQIEKEALPSGPQIISQEMQMPSNSKENKKNMKDILHLAKKMSENNVVSNWTSHIWQLETLFKAWGLTNN